MKERKYIDVNIPRKWHPYLDELLARPEIQKKLEVGRFSKRYSGIGCWIIHQFLINNTSFGERRHIELALPVDLVKRIKKCIENNPKIADESVSEFVEESICSSSGISITADNVLRSKASDIEEEEFIMNHRTVPMTLIGSSMITLKSLRLLAICGIAHCLLRTRYHAHLSLIHKKWALNGHSLFNSILPLFLLIIQPYFNLQLIRSELAPDG